MQELTNIIQQFHNKKILVVGDIMADKYLWGEVERISPEAPVQVVKINKETLSPGGAANLANNITAMGAKAFLVGSISDDQAGKELLSLLRDLQIDISGVVIDASKPTITKTRVLSQNQQLVRLDYETTTEINIDIEDKMLLNFERLINHIDAVVFSDYGKGTLTQTTIESLIQLARDNQKTIIADTKSSNYLAYKGVDLITPNHFEASEMTGIKGNTNDQIIEMGIQLSGELETNVLITRASEGMSLILADNKIVHFPTEAREIYDVSGAGDTVVAALSLAICAGSSYEEAVIIASQAAAIQVSKLGTAAVNSKELLKRFEHEHIKIKNQTDITEALIELRAKNKKIVFTNGCFDLLHPGHIKYLKQASKLGDILIIGLNTDESVKRIKGNNRPIIEQGQRAEMLSQFDFVDLITFFNEDTPERIIDLIKPDIFVKGGDYQLEDLPEAKIVDSYGGKVQIVPFVEGYSSSRIIDKILNLR